MGRLDGKVAAVTGGESGIGEATVRRFLAEGASMAFCDRDGERGQRVAAELETAGGKVTFTQADVGTEAACLAFVNGAAQSVKYAVAFWNDCYDPGGLAWDDSSNNRAFLAGTVSSTNNGASIYLEAKKKPETYLTEKGSPLWKDTFHTRLPKGPSGQFSFPFPFSDMVMGYSKNQKAAKDFLRWVHSEPIFDQWFTSQQGFTLGPTAEWQNHSLWQKDPVMLPFRSLAEIGRAAGYAGPANRAAAEVVTKYIITDMYAKAVQGMPAEDAVKWAHGEIVKIYA